MSFNCVTCACVHAHGLCVSACAPASPAVRWSLRACVHVYTHAPTVTTVCLEPSELHSLRTQPQALGPDSSRPHPPPPLSASYLNATIWSDSSHPPSSPSCWRWQGWSFCPWREQVGGGGRKEETWEPSGGRMGSVLGPIQTEPYVGLFVLLPSCSQMPSSYSPCRCTRHPSAWSLCLTRPWAAPSPHLLLLGA